MRKPQFAVTIGRKLSMAGLKLKKHSPEIMVVSGVIGMVGTVFVACKATTKASEIVKESKKDIQKIRDCAEHPEIRKTTEDGAPVPYSDKDYKKDLTIAYAQTGLKLVKTYAPAIALGMLSTTSILAGHNMLRKRNVALAAAYTTVNNGFKNYRKNVVERFGEELDKELKYNIKSKEVEEKVVDENGEEKVVKKTVRVADPNYYSEFARFFDDGCLGWTPDSEHNLWVLKQQEAWANQKLKEDGYLFLNDVYKELGIPKSKAGQVVGWIYENKDPDSDGFVDFGLSNIHNEKVRDFVNGYEKTILLDFNVDGPILDLI